MACNTITGILKGCEPSNSGGIYEIYIQDSDSVDYTADTTAHTMTTLTATPKFQTFQFNRNVGSANVATNVDLLNGSTFFTATIVMKLNRHTAAKHAAIVTLGAGQRFLDIIVKDANGDYWFYPDAQLTADDVNTGTARADGQSYMITFTAEMQHLPISVTEAQALANIV